MANPQPTDSHLRIANSILLELICRDFYKRHYTIALIILRISWGCGKKYALIPQYTKFFEACGINKGNIKAELEYLVKNNVIFWEKDANIFQFNKDFDKWRIPYPKTINKTVITNVIGKNLQSSQNKNSVLETRQEFQKNENPVLENLELDESENIDIEPKEGSPITNINNYHYNNEAQPINEQEKDFLEKLQSVENYPFDIKKDRELFHKLEQDFPQLDLIEAITAWSVSKLDTPLTKEGKSRSQIHSWYKKGLEFGKYKKQPEYISPAAMYRTIYENEEKTP